jgi:hypothetical protein
MEVLDGIAACGAMIAPLPQALLGAREPLKGFIGQIEPTFNWTLKDDATGQWLTNPIAKAMHQKLFRSQPLGRVVHEIHQIATTLAAQFSDAQDRSVTHADPDTRQRNEEKALRLRLVGQDLMSLVVLGDPAVRIEF